MRNLLRNKKVLRYSLYKGKEPLYKRDEDGNIIYQNVDGEDVPVEIGSTPPHYSDPVEFMGHITYASGESEAETYGVSIGEYDSKLVMIVGELPITETSIIFDESEPEYKDGNVVEKSADFKVIKVAPTLNEVSYLLKRIEK